MPPASSLETSGAAADERFPGDTLNTNTQPCPLAAQDEHRNVRRLFLWDGRYSVNGDEKDVLHHDAEVQHDWPGDGTVSVVIHGVRPWVPEKRRKPWGFKIGPSYVEKAAIDFEIHAMEKVKSVILLIHEARGGHLVFKSILDVNELQGAPGLEAPLRPADPIEQDELLGSAYALENEKGGDAKAGYAVTIAVAEAAKAFEPFRELDEAPTMNATKDRAVLDEKASASAECSFELPLMMTLWRNYSIEDGDDGHK